MARVYRLVGDNGVYIGSTKLPLNVRFSGHKHESNLCMSKQLINPRIELIEECSEEDRYIREQYWMDRTECINHNKSYTGLTIDEYKREYRQTHLENYRRYQSNYEKRPKVQEWLKTPFICPCGGRYKRHSKAGHFRSKRHQKYLDTQGE